MRGSGLGSVAVSGVIRRIIICDYDGGSWQAQDGGKRSGDGEGMRVRGPPSKGAEGKVDRAAIWPHQGIKTASASASASTSHE